MFQVSEKTLVVNHTETPSTFSMNSTHAEAFSSGSPGNGITELAGGEEDKDNIPHVSIYHISIQTKQKFVIDVS